jgi:hypothetical protein
MKLPTVHCRAMNRDTYPPSTDLRHWLHSIIQLLINTFGAGVRKQDERFLVSAGDRELTVSAY